MSRMPDTLNQQWSQDKTRVGYKLLSKFGWKEGKGLGKDESGITNNVKISKREDGMGLGMEKEKDSIGSKAWNSTTSSFNDVLSMLTSSYGSPKKSKKKKRKEADSERVSVGIKYKRMSDAKNLQNKSEEDLTAILGTGSRRNVEEEDVEDEEGGTSDSSSAEKKRKSSKSKKEKKEKKEKKKKKSKK